MSGRPRFIQLRPDAVDDVVERHGFDLIERAVLIDLLGRADWRPGRPHTYRTSLTGYAAHLGLPRRRLTVTIDHFEAAGLVRSSFPRGQEGIVEVLAYDGLVAGRGPGGPRAEEREPEEDHAPDSASHAPDSASHAPHSASHALRSATHAPHGASHALTSASDQGKRAVEVEEGKKNYKNSLDGSSSSSDPRGAATTCASDDDARPEASEPDRVAVVVEALLDHLVERRATEARRAGHPPLMRGRWDPPVRESLREDHRDDLHEVAEVLTADFPEADADELRSIVGEQADRFEYDLLGSLLELVRESPPPARQATPCSACAGDGYVPVEAGGYAVRRCATCDGRGTEAAA